MHKNVLKGAEVLLTSVADVVTESYIMAEVTERGGQIVFLRM